MSGPYFLCNLNCRHIFIKKDHNRIAIKPKAGGLPREKAVLVLAVHEYLAVVENDRTNESPPAASQFTPVHQVLELTDLHCALIPAHKKHHTTLFEFTCHTDQWVSSPDVLQVTVK